MHKSSNNGGDQPVHLQSFVVHSLDNMSRVVGKQFFGIINLCRNKDADQLRGDREADQCLCFRYTDISSI